MEFKLSIKQLESLRDEGTKEALDNFGGIDKLAACLHTNLTKGLNEQNEMDSATKELFPARIKKYGTNVQPQSKPKSFMELLFDALNDTTIIILIVAAIVSLILGVVVADPDSNSDGIDDKNTGWIEGFAILMAVCIVALVTAINDYSKEKKFRALNKIKANNNVTVIRNGEEKVINSFDVVVGDVVQLSTGNAIPADGFLISSYNLVVDQSSMTGESKGVLKSVKGDNFLLAGCWVSEGVGNMLVTCTGEHSIWGESLKKLTTTNEDTPLQEKLELLAEQIGFVGLGFAALTFIISTLHWIYDNNTNGTFEWSGLGFVIIEYFINSITIIVVAVPEGLPLAVTISLAYSMTKMMADNNLVRKLEACETMGGCNDICSDKTGTLTENKMTVTAMWIANKVFDSISNFGKATPLKRVSHKISIPSDWSPYVTDLLKDGIAINSTANIVSETSSLPNIHGPKQIFIGNKTECALLSLCDTNLGGNYKYLRNNGHIIHLQPFTSERKYMSVVISSKENKNNKFIHLKGAPEIVLAKCTTYLNNQGEIVELTPTIRKQVNQFITNSANNSLRTLCLAFKQFSEEAANKLLVQQITNSTMETFSTNLTLLTVVGIKDPLRPNIRQSIEQCAKAGILVRMVTGDNKLTAEAIAREAGILTEGGISMEGKQFRKLSDKELCKIVPNLQVLSRSSPNDKFMLVSKLKELGNVVAVTGDGTNDAPALKKADVGLSMGISGTEVAKEASDIVLLDDNFSSIVKAIMWGRCVYDNIRKFLQFQLTVNIVALFTALVAALTEIGTPLTAVQLLWVNLIMDTMAALALATEPPTAELLKRKPYGRNESLVNKLMWRNIILQSIFQLAVQFVVLKQIHLLEPVVGVIVPYSRMHFTIAFNTFVFCQVFNEVNSRHLNDSTPLLSGILNNAIFAAVIIITVVVQFFFVQFGGSFTQCSPLDLNQWLCCIAIGAISIPLAFLYRTFIPVNSS